MDRRIFLAGALSALGACGAASDCQTSVDSVKNQTARPKIRWKLITSWPKNFPGLGLAPEHFARWVSLMTSGEFEIKVYGAGEIVPALEVFDTVSQGTVQMGHSAAYYWKGKLPAAPFFTSVPFGLNAQEMNGWFHYGNARELWQELYAPYNLIPFVGGNTGVQMAGWFNKEIRSLEDIQGLKMRIPGLAGEVWKRLGGTPVTLPGGELFMALQTGVIDATEWVGPYNDLAFGFYKVAKHYYYPGWHEPGPSLEFIVNQKAYESLPKDFQNIIEMAARAANQDMLDEYTARNDAALVELIETHKVDLQALPNDVLQALRKISEEVVLETAQTSPLARKIFDSFKQYQQGVQAYHAVSEQAYLNARG